MKAIGLRALTTGRFWQFCFLLVVLFFIWRIQSNDWVEIAKLFLTSYVYSGLGWVLWVVTTIVAIVVHRAQRKQYLAEIDRITAERNRLQEQLLAKTQPSKYKKK